MRTVWAWRFFGIPLGIAAALALTRIRAPHQGLPIPRCLINIRSHTKPIGASGESVASEAADAARSYLASGAVAGEHLTDQLLLPFALAGGGTFTAERLNFHYRTNMEIIRCFLRVDFVTSQEGPLTRVAIKPLFVTPRCR